MFPQKYKKKCLINVIAKVPYISTVTKKQW